MSRPVYIECAGIDSALPESRRIAIKLDMTQAQIKSAIVDMLSEGWSEAEAFEWFASEFPEWVKTPKVTA
jgi:hypothetical protein